MTWMIPAAGLAYIALVILVVWASIRRATRIAADTEPYPSEHGDGEGF